MAITLREIRDEDLEMIMRWRMDPDITRYMKTNPRLTIDMQRKWLAASKHNEKVMNWLVQVDDVPVGLINLEDIDWAGANTSWGYYIGEKKYRSLNLAISLELSLYDFVFEVLGFKEIHNQVFSLNAGVVKLHIACGNEIVKEAKGEIEKEGVKYDITHLTLSREKWADMREKRVYEKIRFDLVHVMDNGLLPHHIGYAVADIGKTITSFEALGYELTSDVIRDESRVINIAFMRHLRNDLCIELIEPVGDNSPVSEILKQKKNASSPYHICYVTDYFNKAIYQLKRKGFFVISNPLPAPALNGRRVAFLMNRDAGIIEILENKYHEQDN